MDDSNRALALRWFEEVWNHGRREAIGELVSPDVVLHDGGVDTRGLEGFYPYYDRLRATLSDVHMTIEDTIAEGDRVCVRWSCTARHTGEGFGVPASGTPIAMTGITILRVAGGKLVEGWQNWDMLGMFDQIQGKGRGGSYAVPG